MFTTGVLCTVRCAQVYSQTRRQAEHKSVNPPEFILLISIGMKTLFMDRPYHTCCSWGLYATVDEGPSPVFLMSLPSFADLFFTFVLMSIHFLCTSFCVRLVTLTELTLKSQIYITTIISFNKSPWGRRG